MSEVDTLDEKILSAYLEANVDGFSGPLTAKKFKGGQSNPTFLLEATSGKYVLRRQPPGKLLPSAHAVDREYKVQKALRNTEVPVSKVFHLCEDRTVIGSMFYVMEFCNGNIHWNPSLPEFDNIGRTKIYNEMNRVLAELHSVNIDELGLAGYGKPGNYFSRQFGRWTKQYRASELGKIDAMEKLIIWLENNFPEDDGQVALSHGDYKLDNVMFDLNNEKIIAVLDWELSTLGHPYADLAYQCMTLRFPAANVGMTGLSGLDRSALGIPTEKEYVAMYCKRMGIENIPHWTFYLAFSFFRLAAICQGVAKRAADGNASNKQAAQVGAFVEPLAQMAFIAINE